MGSKGLRYVHYFSENEPFLLAGGTDFEVLDTLLSDDVPNNQGLYQVGKCSSRSKGE